LLIGSRVNLKYYVVSVSFLVLSFIMLVPFIVMLVTSLKTSAETYETVFTWIPRSWQFSNYPKALKMGDWGRWFFNSFFVSVVVTVISVLFNSMGGYAFARLDFRGKNVLFIIMMITLMMPQQVIMVPTFLVMRFLPFAGGNNILGQGGSGLIDTYAGLILNGLAGAFGVFLCRQYFLSFPQAMDDAAEIDGCSPFVRYIQIYLPLGKPVLTSLGVLKITYTWNDYIWPLIITHSERLRTVQLGLTIYRNEYIQWELMMAITVLICLPLIIVFLALQRFFVQGLITSGLKG
jgi:multiple sugar transport system permease protein